MRAQLMWSIAVLALVACSDDEEVSNTGSAGAAGAGNAGNAGGAGGATGGQGGDAGSGASQGGMGGSGGAVTGAPGTLTLTVDNLADADGKVVIASVLEGTDKLGGVCMTINGDPGSASQVVSEVDAIDVCDIGPEVELPGGLVSVRAGIYSEGTPAPEECLAMNVVVDGDTEVQLGAFGPCN